MEAGWLGVMGRQAQEAGGCRREGWKENHHHHHQMGREELWAGRGGWGEWEEWKGEERGVGCGCRGCGVGMEGERWCPVRGEWGEWQGVRQGERQGEWQGEWLGEKGSWGCEGRGFGVGLEGERGGCPVAEGAMKPPEWNDGSRGVRWEHHHEWRMRPHEKFRKKAEKMFHGGLWSGGTAQGLGSLERLCGLRWW